jgi:uncharacterized protein YuzE
MSYDAEVSAAYISFFERRGTAAVPSGLPVDSLGGGGEIDLDLDDADHLLGIEILDASR